MRQWGNGVDSNYHRRTTNDWASFTAAFNLIAILFKADIKELLGWKRNPFADLIIFTIAKILLIIEKFWLVSQPPQLGVTF